MCQLLLATVSHGFFECDAVTVQCSEIVFLVLAYCYLVASIRLNQPSGCSNYWSYISITTAL